MILWITIILQLIQLSHQDCAWNTCNKWSNDKNTVKVHIVPHTHDDLGWIKTVDQYYYGAKMDLVPVGVQYIYNTVIDELQKSPERRFSFAETGFLWRWYTSQGDFEKHKLQKLVKNGQIELIGGGWVQNDEATAHYVDIVDQMTLGLKKLSQLFDNCGAARVAWQIDPFGHSKEMANLFAMMGYETLFFARIHHLEKEMRLQNKSLEFIWNASDDLKTQILTGAFYQDNYGPPEGFCWDALCGDDPIMDNQELEGYNADEKLKAFTEHVTKQASVLRSNHVMLLMGSDFQYTNANSWYTNLDKLIQLVRSNSSSKMEIFYSTPSCYVKGLLESELRLPNKNDDFFPYASSNHSYWTGYFSSRPAFKGMIREASGLLQFAKRLDAIADLGPSDDSDVELMEKASGLAQHHDAVTGTAKENVTRDYEKRLHIAMSHAETVIHDFMAIFQPKMKGSPIPSHTMCLLANETICTPMKNTGTFAITVFNSRGQTMKTTIKIPYFSKNAMVQNDIGELVESQLSKTLQVPQQLSSDDRAPYELFVSVDVPPLGYRIYLVDNSTSIRATQVVHPVKSVANTTVSIKNKFYELTLDDTGLVKTIEHLSTNLTRPFRQEFFYYKGVDNSTNQPSGAYIFRPTTEEAIKFGGVVKVETVKGPVFEEVRQVLSPWISQIIRLYKNEAKIEFDWLIGPIPKEDKGLPISKEIVTRYTTDIDSQNVFYTDSNGRQMMKRIVNYSDSFKYINSEPVAANYFPVTNRVFLNDGKDQLTVLTDRAQGASSRSGWIELMLHRRCFYDDHWGVEEALDEPGTNGKGLVVRGTHVVLLTPVEKAASIHRPMAVEMFHKPIVTVSQIANPVEFRKDFNMVFSGLTHPLPEYLNLFSIEKWHKNSLLLRLEHIFQNEEDRENSRPMTIDIKNMFSQFEIKEVHELMLAGNRNVTSADRRSRLSDFTIQLHPMEIRTFQVEVQRKAVKDSV